MGVMTEDLISDRAILEHFWERPCVLSELTTAILRWQGLDPEKYRLEHVLNLCATRIVRKDT